MYCNGALRSDSSLARPSNPSRRLSTDSRAVRPSIVLPCRRVEGPAKLWEARGAAVIQRRRKARNLEVERRRAQLDTTSTLAGLPLPRSAQSHSQITSRSRVSSSSSPAVPPANRRCPTPYRDCRVISPLLLCRIAGRRLNMENSGVPSVKGVSPASLPWHAYTVHGVWTHALFCLPLSSTHVCLQGRGLDQFGAALRVVSVGHGRRTRESDQRGEGSGPWECANLANAPR